MSVSRSSRKVDKLGWIAIGLAAVLLFPSWGAVFDYLFPIRPCKGFGTPIEQLVRGRGYTLETHRVITEDGYKIEFHRISNPNVTGSEERAPVLIAPVCFSTSKTQVTANNSVSFMFADAGFDVWLLNSRGTFYGREHITLDEYKDRAAFYNFTTVEASVYDLSAQIIRVQQTTAKKKVIMVAYSYGVTLFLTLLSKRPAMQNDIEKAILYGGAHSPCFAKMGLGVATSIYTNYLTSDIFPFFGIHTLQGPASLFLRFPFLRVVGSWAVGLTDMSLMDERHAPLRLESSLERIGLKGTSHVLQNAFPGCDGRVREFNYDFGLMTEFLTWLGLRSPKNIQVYGTREPPVMQLDRLLFPVKIYHAEHDKSITPEAVRALVERLKIPAADVHSIAEKRFNHYNFIHYRGRFHFIDHGINFLKGTPSEWDPHIFDEPSES